MLDKDKSSEEFPCRGINKYLDILYTKIEACKNDFSFHDLAFLIQQKIHEEMTLGDKKRLLRNIGFEIGDGITTQEQAKPFKRSTIRNLYLAFHINPADFLIDEDLEKVFLGYKIIDDSDKSDRNRNNLREGDHIYFTRAYWNKAKQFYTPNPLIEVKAIPLDNHTKTETVLTKFYEKIAPYYHDASWSIIAHEVLFKGNNNDPTKYATYRHAQNQIFEAIDASIRRFKRKQQCSKPTSSEDKSTNNSEKSFSYKRVFYLSPSESIHKKDVNNPRELFKLMMIEASFETLRHIKHCLNNYTSGKDNVICEFYVAPFSGMRAHTLVDDKIIITEDYKKHQDYTKPYIIFIENVQHDSALKTMKDAFDEELAKRNEKKIYLLRKEDFSMYLEEAEEYLENKILEYGDMLNSIDQIPLAERQRKFFNEKTNKLDERKYNLRNVKLSLTGPINDIIKILQEQYRDVIVKNRELLSIK